MRPIRLLLSAAVLLVACGSDPAATEPEDNGDAGRSGAAAGGAGQPAGSSGSSSAGSGGAEAAGRAGASAGAGGSSGDAGAAGLGGSACQPKQLECTCGPSGFGACVADPKGADARVCDCKASAKPKESDAVLTCDAAKAKYPSVSWQAIKTTCPETEACMAMAPEQAEDLSSKWGDRFCRHYPNPADPIGGINEGPGKQIYQYCCKPVAPLLPPEGHERRGARVHMQRHARQPGACHPDPVPL